MMQETIVTKYLPPRGFLVKTKSDSWVPWKQGDIDDMIRHSYLAENPNSYILLELVR